MIRTFLALLATLVPLSAAEAVPLRWQGNYQIVATGGGCDGIRIGTSGRARLRPGIGGENGSDSSLSLFGTRQAMNFRYLGGLFDVDFHTVEASYIGDTYTPFDNAVLVRFVQQQPATLNASADLVDLLVQIRGWEFQPRCTVSLRITLVRRDV